MSRMKRFFLALALIAGLLVFIRPPAIQLGVPLSAQQVNCAGSFTPSFNCIITGFWSFATGANFPVGAQLNGSNINVASVTLNNTQILALNGAAGQVTVIPTPPAGFVNVVLYGNAAFSESSTYSGGSDLKLFYTRRDQGNAASGVITFAGLLDTAASNNEVFTGTIAGVEPGKTNKAVVLQATTAAAFSGGNAANTLAITATYQTYAIGTLK